MNQILKKIKLGMGCAPIGNLFSDVSNFDVEATLEIAWENDIRYFDVAPSYGFGLAERRLGCFLQNKLHSDYVLSTKVGKLLKPINYKKANSEFINTPYFDVMFDYSFDAIMRSYEDSLQRLGVNRIDILFVHDLDLICFNENDFNKHLGNFLDSGYKAIEQLKSNGDILAYGFGLNCIKSSEYILSKIKSDILLLAGRYTLLENSKAINLLDYCFANNIKVVIGGPYNSGVLATGSSGKTFYNYDRANTEILAKVKILESICANYNIPLIAAAIQFCYRNPAVVSVIPGLRQAAEVLQTVAALKVEIPQAFWGEVDQKINGL